MNRIFNRIVARMVYESSLTPKHVLTLNCRSETHLASKLNGIEQRSYEDAISALNALQTNSATIQQSINRTHNAQCTNVKETAEFLEKIGVTPNDLDRLSVIHIAGTKGKGSTCVLVESILRNVNITTGFFSSPHLLNVTERIRLNGKPISKLQFSQYFWKVYNTLEEKKRHADDMPHYFKFLTIMAYYIFLKEQVDVAVVEVGIGGEYDCTNVVRSTDTVGITSLGLEHTQLLGNSYRDIAWQKSGIIKHGSSVFSTHQHDECITVLYEGAHEKHANLKFVPNLSEYNLDDKEALTKIVSNPTKLRNSSLAIQLSYDWIRKNPQKLGNKSMCEYLMKSDHLKVPSEVTDALVNCDWPDRCQTVRYKNLNLYIDGAHTHDSLQLCVDWFDFTTKSSSQKKFLLFNITGDRNANDMLDLINKKLQFHEALFTPNISSLCLQSKDNMYTFVQPNRSMQNAKYWDSLSCENKSQAFDCIKDVFKYLDETYGNEEMSVLITGSLHLVGEVLRSIQD